MNSLSQKTPVGEIAARMPLAVVVFEELGIDFCCGGKVALQDACQIKGLDPAVVLDRIRQSVPEIQPSGASPDWESSPLDGLIDHILSTHHVYMKAQLPRLDALLTRILAVHGERHGDVLVPVSATFRSMKQELDGHLMKEERILFPLIRSLEESGRPEAGFHCGSVQNPIRVMVMEHDSAGEALARLRHLTHAYTAPDDACGSYRAFYDGLAAMERDLHQHIHLENNILFPRAVKLEADSLIADNQV
jgi:regulator of cell morphogenesis and NO signaling